MANLVVKFQSSPMAVRVAPFLLFAGLTTLQGRFGAGSAYWIYLIKVVIGVGLIWLMRPAVSEMRWRISWEAVVVGIAVFVIWVGLDWLYPKWGSQAIWNPHDQFGSGTSLAWFFIAVRMIGVTFVVPPIEEVFYRSFLYRYVAKANFEQVPIGYFGWTPLIVTAVIFGFAHFEWLSAILCALAYQALVIKKKRLGDVMTAHAITNFLLGVWVNVTGAWFFW